MAQRFDILKQLVQPKLGTIILGIILGGIVWFMPEFFGTYDLSASIDVLFMQKFVLWSYPLYVARIIGFIVMVGICIWLMYLSEKLQILPSRSSMPLLIGISMAGVINHTQAFNENLFVIILFILALRQMINMYNFDKQVISGFNIILLLSIATLFEPHYIWLSILIVLGMIIFRIIKHRVFLSIVLGIVTVSILILSIFWLFDSTNILIEYLKGTIDVSFVNSIDSMRKSDIIAICIIIVMMMFTLINCLTSNRNFKLNVRLNFSFIGWCFFVSLVWAVIFANDYVHIIAIPGLFATLCLSLYFTANHTKVANIMFMIYSISIIAYRVVWCLGI